jgi:hypothetical protein
MKLINGFTKQSVKDAILRYVPGDGCIIQETETCVYQAFDEDGYEMRCAVGAFIPDGHKALPKMCSATELIYDHPDLKEHMPLDVYDLLKMQQVHDTASVSSAVVSVVDELFEWIDENIEDSD